MPNPLVESVAFAVMAVVMAVPASAQTGAGSGGVVEVRSYNLRPGTRERFHSLFVRDALPMLQRWKVDVVAYGPSLHDEDRPVGGRRGARHAQLGGCVSVRDG